MTDAASTPAPKKSYAKYVVIIVIILAGWFDYSQTHYLFGKDPVTSDSTRVSISEPVTPIDSAKVASPISDTLHKDTVNKK